MATTQLLLSNPQGTRILTVKANGGNVAVERMVEGTWVTIDLFAQDGAWPLNLGRTATRFTPTGGAAFEISK
ncbi:MAG: hypothetical protein ACRYF9_25775 [Janthinobacterium lividum]